MSGLVLTSGMSEESSHFARAINELEGNAVPYESNFRRKATLEGLKPGVSVRGILPNGIVTVVNAQWFGSDVVELTYKDAAGKVGNELIYRDREADLEIIEAGHPWSFDGDDALFRLVFEALRIRYEATNAPVRVYWFNDRIEIHNPDGPFGSVTMENFGQTGVTDYRNPNLAESLRALGFVQRFGAGIELARKHFGARLRFEVQPGVVAAIISRG